MGIPVKTGAGEESAGGATRNTPQARATKASKRRAAKKVPEPAPVGAPGGADRVNQRLGSMSPDELTKRQLEASGSKTLVGVPGGAARVNQRLGSMSPDELTKRQLGAKTAEAGKGTGAQKYPGKDTKDEQIEPTLVMCIEAFANSMLVPEGHVTFREVFAAFKTHFPLLADEKHMAPNFLGAHLKDWYEAKHRTPLVRAKDSEGGGLRRSALPYQGLSLIADQSQADATLMNEAKVALRRALKMEGVGIMVRRNQAGQYVVATVMPGSPASVGGKVETDDVILAVGGIETDGMSPQQLADAVLGPQGSRVSVTLRRAAVQTQVDGETQRLERVYTLDLVRSDKPIVAPNTPEIAAAERYASTLALQMKTGSPPAQ